MRGVVAFLGMALTSAVAAADCRVSVEGPVAVVELYTSEGCSSCPPADRWLSTLRSDASGPVRIVPLALHVPYWDYIGWKDRYANPEFEARQRQAARQARAATIYTPQVLVNGQDFRGWGAPRFQDHLALIARQPVLATLTLAASSTATGTTAVVTGTAPAGARVILAGTESGLASDVKAGENRGVRLTHDHVARAWIPLGSVGPDGRFEWRRTVPRLADGVAARSALTALVEDPDSGRILQAATLPACAGG